MKKAALWLLCILFHHVVFAADTTTVVSHQDIVIKTNPAIGETKYPQWATFPNTTKQYRKVLMQLSFECAPGLKCGEWDYINNIIIGRTGSKNNSPLNYEIARYITPYGFYWNSSMNWQHSWYYDVTDFALLLHDSVEVIYRHSGYEANNDRGWKVNLKFICIEGTPVLEPVKITKLWDGSYRMGDTSMPVENYLTAQNITLDALTQQVRVKMMNTGHGSDSAEGCMEFCSKYREILWDGSSVSKRDVWRNDCGYNAVYPQAGTWLYDRAGWCPGSPVAYDHVDVKNLTGGSSHTVDMNMQPYVAYKNFGNIYTTAYLIEYKNAAKTNDASLETIMAPSKEVEFKRMNPICNTPIVVIRNNGSANLTSAQIEYGVEGGTMATYQWTGSLATQQYDTVELTNPVNWTKSSGKFVVDIKTVNGVADEYTDDNVLTSQFTAPVVFPTKIIVHFQTNKDASENNYTIFNATTNKVHYQKSGFTNEKLYLDTIDLSPGNCYYFRFSDEGVSSSGTGSNKDGLNFWALNAYEGTGVLRIRNAANGATLKDVTAVAGGPYNTTGGDFGALYGLYFMAAFGMDVTNTSANAASVEVYPNPAGDKVYITYNGLNENGKIYLTDIQGRVLQTQNIDGVSGTKAFNMQAQTPGVYIIKLVSGTNTVVKKLVKQ
ncbi:hypothetical protein CAP35_02230 [Chitinophagaceae bacterium IBVUCB1]|nr:hypothetical protein CAP35_02230 [Chitinophagaceae bacterium IBVUCB1]